MSDAEILPFERELNVTDLSMNEIRDHLNAHRWAGFHIKWPVYFETGQVVLEREPRGPASPAGNEW